MNKNLQNKLEISLIVAVIIILSICYYFSGGF